MNRSDWFHIRKCWLGFALAALVAVPIASAERDPFLRVDLDDLNHPSDYRRVWSAKLELTPFDCGRFVVLPAFEPECSVSIYSSRNSAEEPRYRVTYVIAKQNIWQASDGLRDIAKATAVKTTRIDVDIPKSTAELLRKVWSRMLTGFHPYSSQAPRVGKGNTRVILIDPPYFEWSLQQRNKSDWRLQRNLYIKGSTRVSLFADLSDITLPKYCKASRDERSAILGEIEKQARQLLNKAD